MSNGILTDTVKTVIARGFVGDREALENAILEDHLPTVEYFHQQGVLLNSFKSLVQAFLHAACQERKDMLEHLFTVYDIDDTLIFMATVKVTDKPGIFSYLSMKRRRRFNQGEHDILLYHAMARGGSLVAVKFLLAQGAIPQKEGVKAVLARDDLDMFLAVYHAIPGDIISSTKKSAGKRVLEFLQDMDLRLRSDASSTALEKLIERYL